MSSSVQKKAIKEFRAVTGSTEQVATAALSANGYNLERAIDDYYSNKRKYSSGSSSSSSSSSSSKADVKKLTALFDQYASEDDKDVIDGEALQTFFRALDVKLDGPMPLALAWQYKCEEFASVARKEFMQYYQSQGIDTLEKMKADVKRVEGLLEQKSSFKEFYRWLFDFVKEEPERKTIDNDIAFSLWSAVLPQHFALTSEWLAFCKSHKSLKAISHDTWQQLIEFAFVTDKDLSNYDEDGAWPVIIDEFVEHYRKQK